MTGAQDGGRPLRTGDAARDTSHLVVDAGGQGRRTLVTAWPPSPGLEVLLFGPGEMAERGPAVEAWKIPAGANLHL
ncbi:hypothetical protein NDU88_004088 [Pleurodeles waltl]|uniref:Uncharacterized protein n=1 Tax=Pleurodeles waltl TaxID=8319 RepID=A0AAV7QHF5_PLEWA|nr:hypothetical protein NDU88_004088 [Pleurodeles waltl]